MGPRVAMTTVDLRQAVLLAHLVSTHSDAQVEADHGTAGLLAISLLLKQLDFF